MSAATRDMALGGKRARMGTGRARTVQRGARISEGHARRFTAVALAEGITRTTLIERWIEEHFPPASPL